jgi:hypothetical protein
VKEMKLLAKGSNCKFQMLKIGSNINGIDVKIGLMKFEVYD